MIVFMVHGIIPYEQGHVKRNVSKLGEFGFIHNAEEEWELSVDIIVEVYCIQHEIEAGDWRIPECTEAQWVEMDHSGTRITADLKCDRRSDKRAKSGS